MNEQVDIFEDVCWVCYSTVAPMGPRPFFGPYYCRNKANEKLITLLSEGICAWVTYDIRKTEFWRIEEGRGRRPCAMA